MFLEDLPYRPVRIIRQISAENPTGEPGNACRWDPCIPKIPSIREKDSRFIPFYSWNREKQSNSQILTVPDVSMNFSSPRNIRTSPN